MKIKDLIKILEKHDPNRIIVLSSDSEGNNYDTLNSVSKMVYKDGQVGYEKLTPSLKESGYSEEDILVGGKKAVVLYP